MATAQIERPELAPAPFQAPVEGARFVFEDLASGKTQSGRFGATEDMLTRFTWDGREAASLTPFCADCALGLPNDGGPLAGKADQELIVPGTDTERIQEAHQVVLHLLLDAVEVAFT